jgi:uncharacterized protein
MITRKELLNRIQAIVLAIEPNAKIYLYGSRARGAGKNDSDWDLLILIDKEKITAQDEYDISSPLYELEFEVGEVISPMIYTEKEWFGKYTVTPFYSNVMREGILL